eukprot:scaffold100_cov357-Prasinococcus_capsulatus_cf.AAC.27
MVSQDRTAAAAHHSGVALAGLVCKVFYRTMTDGCQPPPAPSAARPPGGTPRAGGDRVGLRGCAAGRAGARGATGVGHSRESLARPCSPRPGGNNKQAAPQTRCVILDFPYCERMEYSPTLAAAGCSLAPLHARAAARMSIGARAGRAAGGGRRRLCCVGEKPLPLRRGACRGSHKCSARARPARQTPSPKGCHEPGSIAGLRAIHLRQRAPRAPLRN